MLGYEEQYTAALMRIKEEGFSDGTNERTGVATKRLPGIVFQIDVEKEFPILKSKQVFGKTSMKEILWIWQAQSNRLKDLDASIWDEWGDEHGTIGMAYEYQIAKPVNIFLDPVHKAPESFRHYNSQTEYVLEYLRENPNGRWGVVTLWNPAELSGMNLVPCCHTSTWNLDGGRLNCVLDQRSGDMPYGVPFNTTQYAELMILLARDLGVKPGILTHVIADAHIYDRQMEGVDIQIKNYTLVEELRKKEFSRARQIAEEIYTDSQHSAFVKPWNSPETVLEAAKNALASRPEFACITEDTPAPFFEVSADDWKIKNYAHMGRVDFGDVVV